MYQHLFVNECYNFTFGSHGTILFIQQSIYYRIRNHSKGNPFSRPFFGQMKISIFMARFHPFEGIFLSDVNFIAVTIKSIWS